MAAEIDLAELMTQYNGAASRLILLDYDGTLIPFADHPSMAMANDRVKDVLGKLSGDLRNSVMLISGRDRESLDLTWKNIPIVLTAEHGGYYKNPGNTWQGMFPNVADWIPKVIPSLNALVRQFEGSFLERKSYSLTWHYRSIADKIPDEDLNGILAALSALPTSNQFQIYEGEFTIELRTPLINKGTFVSRWMGTRHYDFIMAVGDGKTDEDLFRIFDEDSFTIRVGAAPQTSANFILDKQEEVLPLLERIVYANQEFIRAMTRTGLIH